MRDTLSPDARAVVEAVQDLTRLTLALHGDFASKSDAIRRLSDLSISSTRIAAILAIPPGDVSSALAKEKKRQASVGTGDAVAKTSTDKSAVNRGAAASAATTDGAGAAEGERADA